MPFLTLSEEDSLLSAAEAGSSLVTVEQIGSSVEGRPIRIVRIGDPVPTLDDRADVLFVGAQHGNEPAGREALLEFIEDLGNGDSAAEALVAGLNVLIVPTANPDGIAADERRNANEADLNRDWLELAEPETQSIAAVLGTARPHVVVDQHESRNNIDESSDIEYRGAQHPMAYSGINDLSIELRDRLIATADTAGWVSEVYLSGGNVTNIRQLDAHVNFRHSVTLLAESNAGSTLSDADRTAVQRLTTEDVLDWLSGRHQTVTDTTNAAAVAAADAGRDAVQEFFLRSTSNLDPPPRAYSLTASQAEAFSFHAEVFNIAGETSVDMAQAAYALIPPLMDPDSVDRIVSANRLFEVGGPSLPSPVGPPVAVGAIRSEVRWQAHDDRTGRIVADLPDVTGTTSRLLMAYTSGKLSIPLTQSGPSGLPIAIVEQATQMQRCSIVQVVNDMPMWAGRVLVRRGGSSGTLTLGVASSEQYLLHRRVKAHNYAGLDRALVAADLLTDAGSTDLGAGMALEVDASLTGDVIDQEYLPSDLITVYKALRELAEPGTLEWTIDYDWADSSATVLRRILRLAPRIGADSANPPVFETANDVEYELSEDFSSGRYANHVRIFGDGEGDDLPVSDPHVDQAALDSGMPIVEHVVHARDVSDPDELNKLAATELALRMHGAELWEADAVLTKPPRLGLDANLGDTAQFKFTSPRHPSPDGIRPGVEGDGRVIGWDTDTRRGRWQPKILDPHETTAL